MLINITLVFLCLSAFTFNVSTASAEPKTIDLGYGYVLVEEEVPHATAKILCDSIGKQLVSIESMEEDELILSLLRNSNSSANCIWTSGENGVNIIENPAVWRWGNNVPMFYTRWHPGQPFVGSNGYCLYLDWDWNDRLWYTKECTFPQNPLCENKKHKF